MAKKASKPARKSASFVEARPATPRGDDRRLFQYVRDQVMHRLARRLGVSDESAWRFGQMLDDDYIREQASALGIPEVGERGFWPKLIANLPKIIQLVEFLVSVFAAVSDPSQGPAGENAAAHAIMLATPPVAPGQPDVPDTGSATAAVESPEETIKF